MSERKKVWPESADHEQEQVRKYIHDILCQHFVCLGLRLEDLDEAGNPLPKQRRVLCSCFVVAIGDRWFLVTAGHILKELAQGRKQAAFRIIRSFLVDYFGDRTVEHSVGEYRNTINKLTPFPYDDCQSYYIDDEQLGLDFGFIPLRELYKEGLKANGIRPITESQWTDQSRWDFESYWLLGIPKDITDSLNRPTDQGDSLDGMTASVLVSAEAVHDKSLLPANVVIPETRFPQFIGRINIEIPFNIEGMSGGPIFGFARSADDELGYTVVGLQKSWFDKSRVILGCPLSVFGELMRYHAPALLRLAQQQ